MGCQTGDEHNFTKFKEYGITYDIVNNINRCVMTGKTIQIAGFTDDFTKHTSK